jgi:chromosome partitioning protein
MDMANFLTTKQVAGLLGVDTKTVLRYLRSGRLRGSKIGRDYRISEDAVRLLLNSTSKQARTTDGAVVTAIANQKGGVGKTTTTFNLGVALHRQGRRVLLVDLDPQAALTVSAGIPPAAVTLSVYNVLLEGTAAKSVIRPTSSGVDLLPSTIDLAAAEIELVNMMQRELVLKDTLGPLRADYDDILIDCPPSLGLLTINALAAADQVIVPLQCEFLATRGLALLLQTIEKVRERLNRELVLAGILPTMFDGRTVHATEVLTELRTNFPGQVFDSVIKHTVRIKESPATGQPILDYDPEHEVAQAFMTLAKEVVAHA